MTLALSLEALMPYRAARAMRKAVQGAAAVVGLTARDLEFRHGSGSGASLKLQGPQQQKPSWKFPNAQALEKSMPVTSRFPTVHGVCDQ